MKPLFQMVDRKRFLFFVLALAVGLLFQAAILLKNRALNKSPRVSELLQERMAEITAEYHDLWSVSPDFLGDLLVEAIIEIESGGNPRRVGAAGERGLMQIMPDTWAEMTEKMYGRPLPFNRAFDPELNRQVGRYYLAYLQEFLQANRTRWRADERALLLACYNGGLGRVEQAGFDVRRLPASVQDYVRRGSALHNAILVDSLQQQRQVAAQSVGLPIETSGTTRRR